MNTPLEELSQEVSSSLAGPFSQILWAEEEVDTARKRHPESDTQIWDSFPLLPPTHRLMNNELVYRSHVRELLERVASGEDTRPGTWAEIVCVCCAVSLKIPMHGALSGLYFRAWDKAFPEQPMDFDGGPHEALYASEIDDMERDVRRKLAVAERRIQVDQDA